MNFSVFHHFSENSESPVVEAGGSHGHMSPEEHYRRMMSAISEPGSYEEQQQRLYQLASSMGLPGHGQFTHNLCSYVCQSLSPLLSFILSFRLITYCTSFHSLHSKQCFLTSSKKLRRSRASVTFVLREFSS